MYGLETVVSVADGPSDLDVIAVHGLLGTECSPGAPAPDVQEDWLIEYVRSEPLKSRLSVYSYPIVDDRTNVLVRDGLRDQASQLLAAISGFDRGENASIAFVGHDLGGTLIKEGRKTPKHLRFTSLTCTLVLIQAAGASEKPRNVYDSTKWLCFFGCPHTCEPTEDLEASLSRLFTSAGSIIQLPRSLAGGVAAMLTEVNRDFLELKAYLQIFVTDYISNHNDLDEQVFRPSQVTLPSLRKQIRVQQACTLPHRELALHGVRKSDQNENASQEIVGSMDNELSLRSPTAISKAASTKRRNLGILVLGAQFPPIDETMYLQECENDKKLLSIVEYETFKEWNASSGVAFLLVHGSSLFDPARIAHTILDFYIPQDAVATIADTEVHLFFEFRCWDCRYNSVESMLTTFLANVVTSNKSMDDDLQYFIETAETHGWWNVEDLFSLFHLYLVTVSQSLVKKPVTWILANLDERIKSSMWLLRKLENLAASSEFDFKAVIVNEETSTWASESTSFQRISVGERQQNLGLDPDRNAKKAVDDGNATIEQVPRRENSSYGSGCAETLRLVLEKPKLYPIGPSLRLLFDQCSQDSELHDLVKAWFRTLHEDTSLSELENKISELKPISPSKALHQIVMPIVRDSKTSQPVDNVLDLILHSFRPFSVQELAELSKKTSYFCSFSDTSKSPTQGLFDSGSPLQVLLRMRQNEVHLRHQRFRDLLLSHRNADGTVWLSSDRRAAAHARIASACLEYLLSSDIQKQMIRQASSRDVPLIDSRSTLISYAAKHWPTHAKLAGAELPQGTGPLKVFLQNKEAVSLWTRVYRNHSNPIIRAAASSESPLWIFAEHALESLLETTLDESKDAFSLQHDCLIAMEAAARGGHLQTVRRILRLPLPDNCTLDKAIMAAFDSDCEELIMEVLRKASVSPRMLADPSAIFSRAALLQKASIARFVTSYITSGNASLIQTHDCLAFACRGGDLEIAKLALDMRPRLDASTRSKYDISQTLIAACLYGHYGIVSLLIEMEACFPATLSKALEATIISGHFRSLRGILDTMSPLMFFFPFWVRLTELAASRRKLMCLRELLRLFSHPKPASEKNLASASVEKEPLAGPHAAKSCRKGLVPLCLDSSRLSGILGKALDQGDAPLRLVQFIVDEAFHNCGLEISMKAVTEAFEQAVDKNDTKIAGFFLKKGVDPNKRGVFEQTPLVRAACWGHADMVKLLVDANADIHAKDEDGWTPLHMAYDNVGILQILKDAGADIEAKTDQGETPLFLACKYRQKEVVREILKHKPKLDCIVDGKTELSTPIACGDVDIFTMLLDAGIDPCKHSAMELKPTLIYSCVRESRPEMLKALLCYDIAINETDIHGDSALHHCINGPTEVELLKLLVNRGASIELRNYMEATPLMVAVDYDNIEATKFLLSKGANVNAHTVWRSAPLHFACSGSSWTMIELLINSRADINVASLDTSGTPFQAACAQARNKNDFQIPHRLIETGLLDVNQSSSRWGCNLNVACLMTNLQVVDMLFEHGADVYAEDSVGRRPIHFALYRNLDIVQRLIEKGAELFETDLMQRNALHFAVASGQLDVVRHVLEQDKGLVHQRDIDGWTPLLWAIRSCRSWNREPIEQVAIIRELLECGASRAIRGESLDGDWTPSRLAKYQGLDGETISRVTPSEEEIEESGEKALWQRDSQLEEIEVAKYQDDYCSVCLVTCVGVYYTCDVCFDFSLCFKCYRSKNLIHLSHAFNSKGEDDESIVSSIDEDLDEAGKIEIDVTPEESGKNAGNE